MNDNLSVLTALSVVLLPATLIASIWGMNVALPGDKGLGEFWLLMTVMAISTIAAVVYFRRRGWL